MNNYEGGRGGNQRYQRDNFQPYPYRSYDDFNVGPSKRGRGGPKRGYNDPSQPDDRYYQNQHGPPRGYYMPPYGIDPYYYGPQQNYSRDNHRGGEGNHRGGEGNHRGGDNRKGMSMYPDRRQTMDYPSNNRNFNGNFDQRQNNNMDQQNMPNRRHTQGPPRDNNRDENNGPRENM